MAVIVGQPAARDREQPGRCGRASRPEPPLGDDRRRERLGGEIRRDLWVAGATREVAEQRLDMAVVEHSEGLRIFTAEKFLVVEPGGVMHAGMASLPRVSRLSPAKCDGHKRAPSSDEGGERSGAVPPPPAPDRDL